MMNDKNTVWIVDDDKSIRWVFEKALTKANITFECFSNTNEAINKFNHEKPQVIISDIRMPGMDGITLLNKIKEHSPSVPVIIMTAYSDLDRAVSAFQGGAFEYLPKPFDVDEVVSLVKRAITHKQNNRAVFINEVVDVKTSIKEIDEIHNLIEKVAPTEARVLITGGNGTGKELVASALHAHSPRSTQAFIAVNCGAIPEGTIDSELFGHEKGAFTGASRQRQGRFEQANGGTLFLDEIGDMPAEAQTRLLRVLADGEFYRVGGHNLVKVDVRIIAATHQDLTKRVEQGLFREDFIT